MEHRHPICPPAYVDIPGSGHQKLPSPVGREAYPTAINDLGQIVGVHEIIGPDAPAGLWRVGGLWQVNPDAAPIWLSSTLCPLFSFFQRKMKSIVRRVQCTNLPLIDLEGVRRPWTKKRAGETPWSALFTGMSPTSSAAR